MTAHERHCVRCGGTSGPWSSDKILRCVPCEERTAEERREYHRQYHAARNAAIRDLVDKHPRQFKQLFAKHAERFPLIGSREDSMAG